MSAVDVETRVRAICLALPEVTERLSHGSPAFFVGKQFVMLWPHGHHDNGFAHMWCAAPAGAQEGLVSAARPSSSGRLMSARGDGSACVSMVWWTGGKSKPSAKTPFALSRPSAW